MKGKFYGVGVGPGDPELLTLKAKRIIEEAEVIAVPSSPGKSSTALEIIKQLIQGKALLELTFPMTEDLKKLEDCRQKAAAQICRELDQGRNTAFITLGDPTVYSTFIYVYKLVKMKGYAAEIIPGVTSFCAAASKAGVSLSEGRETIAVVPGTADLEKFEQVLKCFDTVVVMKASVSWEKIKAKLNGESLLAKAVLIERCGMDGECITRGMELNNCIKPGYFSTLVIKKDGVD